MSNVNVNTGSQVKHLSTSQANKSLGSGSHSHSMFEEGENPIIVPGNLQIHPPQVTFADMTTDLKDLAFELGENAFRK